MTPKTSGMRTFLTVWAGQLVSLVGSALGSFALSVWVYETTGSATRFALAPFAGAVTGILLLPVAGVVADRWDRRRLMFLSDAVGTLLTLVATWLLFTGQLRVWHVYLLVIAIAGASTFQTPAFAAAITTLVPRQQLARASGMVQSARAISLVIGPISAGLLIAWIGYHGVMAVDCVTFAAGLATLAVVRFPRPVRSEAEGEGEAGKGHRAMWRDALFGWVYIRARPGLLRLLGLFACTNFSLGMLTILLTPLVLSFSTVASLGTVRGAAASGLVAGGLLLSLWGGPERRMPTIFLALAAQAVVLFLAAARPSVVLIAVAGFLFTLVGPIINGLSQAIWQSKVPQDVQGRVFAIRMMIAMSAMPLAFLLAGPLADHVFEPLLMPGGALADNVGLWFGVGPGRGIGLLFIVLGVLMLAITAMGALSPRLRNLETEVPDAGVEPGRAAEDLDPVGA
jgi:MFS family permease